RDDVAVVERTTRTLRNDDADHLATLADTCDRGARSLTYEADHAAEVLATRSGGDSANPRTWAQRKRPAAAAATDYAGRLRAEANNLHESGRRAAPQLLAQADQVATAANVGGILVDGSRLDAAAAAHPLTSDDQRSAIAAASEQRQA